MSKTQADVRSVQDELQQSKPFASKSQEAYLALLRTADAAKRVATRTLESSGITLQQYNVLRILRGAGEEGLPTLSVADRMIERTPGVTRLIDRMVERGWVERVRCTEDRRRVWCRITEGGLDLLEALDPSIDIVDGLLGDALSEAELSGLIDVLDRARAHIRDRESAGGDCPPGV
ncbi:MAG: MarR family transcriptional regulator [Gemmatimonadota bacterium]